MVGWGECGKRLMGCGKVGGVVRLLWSVWRGRLVRERGRHKREGRLGEDWRKVRFHHTYH